jgi:hypothetical protein
MKEIEVKKHREMIVVVSALVDEKNKKKTDVDIKVYSDMPYAYLVDNVAGVLIGIGESLRRDIKEQKEDDNETDKV